MTIMLHTTRRDVLPLQQNNTSVINIPSSKMKCISLKLSAVQQVFDSFPPCTPVFRCSFQCFIAFVLVEIIQHFYHSSIFCRFSDHSCFHKVTKQLIILQNMSYTPTFSPMLFNIMLFTGRPASAHCIYSVVLWSKMGFFAPSGETSDRIK